MKKEFDGVASYRVHTTIQCCRFIDMGSIVTNGLAEPDV